MTMLRNEPRQHVPVIQTLNRGPERRPFWKTIPRFEREYDFRDFLQAIYGLSTRTNREIALADQFAANARLLFRNGRECLFAILKSLKLRSGARVGVPLYCCGSVFEAIAAAGCVPIFLDVDLGTYSVDLGSLEQNKRALDAVVIVHSFGYPANLGLIRTCLGTTNIPVIEDCAHALFSEYQGSPVGVHTDASFFSFGLHKPAAVGGGGIALFNDPALAKRAVEELGLPLVETRWRELRHVMKSWSRGFAYHRPIYGALLASPLGQFRDGCLDPGNNEDLVGTAIHYSLKRMRRCDQILLEGRLREFRDKLPLLLRNTNRFRTAVQTVPLEIPEEPEHGRWNHYLVPVRYRDANRRALGRRFLARVRVDTGSLFRNCIQDARRFGYAGGCPKAEKAVQTVCTVPHHPWLTDSEVGFIGESLRRSTEVRP